MSEIIGMTCEPWTIAGADGQMIYGDTHTPTPGIGEPVGVLVVSHGFKGYKDYGFFPQLAEAASAAGLVAHRFNFSHSGMTNRIETFERPDLFEQDTWGKQIADLGRVIEDKAEPSGLPIVLFGHSRGGVTSLLSAARLGEGLAGVIAAASPHEACKLDEQQRAMLRKHGRLASPSARTGQTLYVGSAWLDEIEKDPDGVDPVLAVRKLTCPVLLIYGDQDATVPTESMHQYQAACPTAEIVTVPGASHTFNAPNPLPLNEPPPPQTRAMIDATIDFALRRANEA